jgi:hypothetical protein
MAGTGTINRESHGVLFDRTFDEIKAEQDKVPLQGKMFFKEVKAPRLDHKMGTVSETLDLPVRSEDEDDLPMVEPVIGFNKTFDLLTYRSAIKVTRKMVELDQHALIARLLGGLGNSASRKREFQYADVFNGAFTDVGSDAVALFSNSHPHSDVAGGTWDNLEPAAELTTDSYSDMRLNMRNRTGEKGFVAPRNLNELVVVAEKERKAIEIMGSSHTAENDLNNIYAWAGESTVVVWDWLTSTTAWFGRDKTADELDQGLYEFIQAPLDIADVTSDFGHDIIMAKRLRFTNAVGATILKAWNGSAGA